MIEFNRYPHVKDFMDYYANDLSNQEVVNILASGVKNREEAELLCKFVWDMIDKMADDYNNDKPVFGEIDNSEVLPDVQYEVTLYLTTQGYGDVWDVISDQVNP